MGQMLPILTTSWDPGKDASGPCNLIVHRAPTNQVSTNLKLPHWFLPSQTGRRTFSVPFLIFHYSNCHETEEEKLPICWTVSLLLPQVIMVPIFIKPREKASLFPLSLLHYDWPVTEHGPLPTHCLEELTPLHKAGPPSPMTHGFVKKVLTSASRKPLWLNWLAQTPPTAWHQGQRWSSPFNILQAEFGLVNSLVVFWFDSFLWPILAVLPN